MHYRKEILIEQIEKDMRMCDMTISPKISTTTTFIIMVPTNHNILIIKHGQKKVQQ